MTRREFVIGGSAAALSGCVTGTDGTDGSRLRIGVLSDIHLSIPELISDEHDKDVCRTTPVMFERALRYFRERGVDAVAIAGDLTEYGMVAELAKVGEIWRKVFPDDRGKDGETVAKIFIAGNHDANAWQLKSTWFGGLYEGAEKERRWNGSIAKDPAAAWRTCFGEPCAPLEIRDVKGFKFVLGHWIPRGVAVTDARSPETEVKGLGDFLEAHRAELAGDRPFFYLQHAHPKGTCLPFAPCDCGGAKRALSRFPNAVAFSGHAHQPLTDERGFWHGEFVSIGTASLIDAGGRNFRENGAPFASGAVDDPRGTFLDTGECRQGLYVTVEGGRLTVERRDFTWGLSMGPDWTVPETPREIPPPAFPKGAELTVTATEKDVTLTFPAANAGGRTYDYEARAVLVADDYECVSASRRIVAPDYHLPPAKADRPGAVRFAREALPRGCKLRFEVRPVDCRGRTGAPLSADWTSPSRNWFSAGLSDQ